MLDLEALRIIWWVLLGILIIAFAISDGFDLGVAALFPWVARNELERDIVLNSVIPYWEGNQVWIILGAGAIFAAWPLVYAVAFSGFYFLMLLLLLTMGISRPVSFKYRSKLKNPTWCYLWDKTVFIGGVFPALLFGILIGNVLQGLSFQFDEQLRVSFAGSFLSLLNPFALWCGLTSLVMLVMHGGVYLAIKTENPIRERALYAAQRMALLLIIFFTLGGFWIAYQVPGYAVVSAVSHDGYSMPLHKAVEQQTGLWLLNYSRYPLALLAPFCGLMGAMGTFILVRVQGLKLAFLCSSLSLAGVITTVGVSMFPFILPSSQDTASSLLVWDASSTQLTLYLMLGATLFFIPLILIYTAWVYYVLRGKVRA